MVSDYLDFDPDSQRPYLRFYFVGQKGLKCLHVISTAGWARADCVCLGKKGVHFFAGIADPSKLSVEQALNDIRSFNAIALPSHMSGAPIPEEALALFQEHGPDLE